MVSLEVSLEAPFRTAEGLLLEGEDLLIRWGAPLEPTGPPAAAEVLEDADGWLSPAPVAAVED